ncbi:MAG: DNA-3-methyladenine glycosylase [Candidatus Melainabacteria bacterium]|nr:DNA-3-methyladenine glycosylase [Candidatus Melainabacteria bacterium]
MFKPLKRSFFERNTLEVAPELLGKNIILRQSRKKERRGIIVEVEAYTNDDPACHAARGKTLRNEVMFGPGGFSYVYFIYGMYHCLNFVTEEEGIPGAVLIRALEIPDEDPRIASGPGKLCKHLKITKNHNKLDCCNEDSSLIVTNNNSNKKHCFPITQTQRIGISQASHYPWRWYIKDNPSVSKTIEKRV